MQRSNLSLPVYPTLILQHLYGSSAREWHKVSDELQAHFRCIPIDAPGFGDAATVDGATVEEMAHLLNTLIESLQPEPCLVVGHSMTGKVSMVAANRRPANLVGLILVGPSPLEPEPMSEDDRATLVGAQRSAQAAREFFLKGARRQLSAQDIEQGVEDVLRANPVAWRRWPQSGAREDWSGAIGPISTPTLLVIGEEDPAISLQFQKEHTIPHLTNCRLEVIPGVGHLVPYEAPKELASLILSFAAGLF